MGWGCVVVATSDERRRPARSKHRGHTAAPQRAQRTSTATSAHGSEASGASRDTLGMRCAALRLRPGGGCCGPCAVALDQQHDHAAFPLLHGGASVRLSAMQPLRMQPQPQPQRRDAAANAAAESQDAAADETQERRRGSRRCRLQLRAAALGPRAHCTLTAAASRRLGRRPRRSCRRPACRAGVLRILPTSQPRTS